MKTDQHPFPTNMLDAKGKTKVLTLGTAEKSTSVDPQHQITTNDAKGKGMLKESSSSERPPRSGVVITRRRQRENWQQREDQHRCQQEERHREEWNRHKDHWDCLLKGRDGGLEGGEQSFLKTIAPANRNKCGIKSIGLAKTTPVYLSSLAPCKRS